MSRLAQYSRPIDHSTSPGAVGRVQLSSWLFPQSPIITKAQVRCTYPLPLDGDFVTATAAHRLS